MAKQSVQVEVEQSGYDMTQHLAKLVAAYKQAVKDGWQTGQDVPAIVMAVIAEGPGLMADLANVQADLKEDKIEFIKGVNLGAYDIAAAALG